MILESGFYKYLDRVFSAVDSPAQKLLKSAMAYSLKPPASRFRPRLCFATAQSLGKSPKQILPWALAIEMIHTASLIHDDMPCMDNARLRRGKACNHIKFGQDIALLAGTCLFIESFALLQQPVFDKKRKALLELLVATTGFKGLMSGQAMDLRIKKPSKKQNLNIMKLKTGVLISACVKGPSLLWSQNKSQTKKLEQFADNLGLAYQLADDFKDKKDNKDFYFKTGTESLNSNLKLLETLQGNTKPLKALNQWLKERFYL